MKRNEVLIHGTTWMSLGNVMLSERSPSQRDEYCTTSIDMKYLK